MNNSQRQNILNKIEQIEQLSLIDLLNQAYPNEGDASRISIGNFNAAELIQLIQRVMIQLKAELTDGLGIYLPQSENFQNDFGDINLERDLSNIFAWLSSADFNSVSAKVESFIYYQIINGFWDKTRIKVDSSKAETEKLIKELNVVQGKLNGFIDRNATLVQNLQKATNDVTVFLESKRSEFITLTENQNTSTATLQSINEVLARSTSIEGDLKKLLQNQTDTAKTVSENVENNQKSYTKINSELTNLQKSLSEALDNAKSDLKIIIDSKTEIIRKGLDKKSLDPALLKKLENEGLLERIGKTNSQKIILSKLYFELTDNRAAYTDGKPIDGYQVGIVVMNHIQQFGKGKMKDFEYLLRNFMSRGQVKYVISKMVTDGLLDKKGEGKATEYFAGAKMSEGLQLFKRAMELGFKEMQRLGELTDPNSPEIRQKKLPEADS